MLIDILTLFPEMFDGPFDHSIIKRAIEREIVKIKLHNIRDHGVGKHKVVDDYPYGGGEGMVMMPEPLHNSLKTLNIDKDTPVVLLTPQGRKFDQKTADDLAKHKRLVFICGRYEGVDERVRQHMVTDEISIGDYVISGGELAVMVVVDGIIRRLPGALGAEIEQDSMMNGLLEFPQYTRPAQYEQWEVPPVLLSGNHAEIAKWRRQQSIERTAVRRPDLLKNAELSASERQYIEDEMKDK
ncbi:MAG: tRNA (guanosine(37)-N1)-methyltransferase TrmD [Chloroflexi bacterium]|nr:tRNA (guanosine(37)-N1)-methyltransferase TrmD [Chloroflexota bacterium]MBT7082446.1 tRNA (guanosine(37)-N1)-methyltransferase TrmD [Chloroflexota bacterium]MBT7290029.1 tRNA (guanosine(37)-N1)-methyltransferase TrmD [Chloroflexota bacterium]